MCFRPAEADAASGVQPTPCKNCGKTVFPTEGLLPKKCPFCREELIVVEKPSIPVSPGSIDAPPVPQAPEAPKMPIAPQAPQMDE